MPCHAMFIRSFFVYLFIFVSQISASCPYIRTSVILAECVFDTSLYISLGAHILNSNSINVIGHYSFGHNNNIDKLINNPLIYNLGNRWMLLLPLLLKCSQQPVNLTFTECQYTIKQRKHINRSPSVVEYMTTQLRVVNITNLGMQSVLFLQQGEIILRSCKAYDCSNELVYLTASNQTFNFNIDYEKPIGTKCQLDQDCSNRYSIIDVIQCDQVTQTCQCSNENITTVDMSDIGRLCTDSIDQTNCTKFPQRCLQWCDESKTSHCVCPKYTRKVKKVNGVFDCELEPRGICRFDDENEVGLNIRKCPTGTICRNNRCRSLLEFEKLAEVYQDETFLSTTTRSMFDLFSSTQKQINAITTNFTHILIIIAISSLLCFLLIIFIITMLIKTRRCLVSPLSADRASSSSFTQSTSTAISTDFPLEIYQFKQFPIISTDNSKCHENYSMKNLVPIHGLVSQTNLSPRFYRQHQGIHERERQAPLQMQSLSYVRPFVDHGLLTTKTYNHTKKRTHQPTLTHLQNGDVLISA